MASVDERDGGVGHPVSGVVEPEQGAEIDALAGPDEHVLVDVDGDEAGAAETRVRQHIAADGGQRPGQVAVGEAGAADGQVLQRRRDVAVRLRLLAGRRQAVDIGVGRIVERLVHEIGLRGCRRQGRQRNRGQRGSRAPNAAGSGRCELHRTSPLDGSAGTRCPATGRTCSRDRSGQGRPTQACSGVRKRRAISLFRWRFADPPDTRMTATPELLGYAAAALVFLTFSLRSITALRTMAIASNLMFIAYALAAAPRPRADAASGVAAAEPLAPGGASRGHGHDAHAGMARPCSVFFGRFRCSGQEHMFRSPRWTDP